MNRYRVIFREMDFCCNKKELVTSPLGERQWLFIVKAKDIEEAYYRAVELVRKETKLLVNLHSCVLMEE